MFKIKKTYKNGRPKFPYTKWPDLDKIALRRELLREEYGENSKVLERAVKLREEAGASHSFSDSLYKLHTVAIIDRTPVVIPRIK